jgi:hypothetical protein
MRRRQRENDRCRKSAEKSAEKSAHDAFREQKRQKKLEIRLQHKRLGREQKEDALKRAAELVASNRIPIEITLDRVAAKAAAQAVAGTLITPTAQTTIALSNKTRSSIVVSTASDLHQIVTHSKKLWMKYNAIAKEHNQKKVHWITVASELGIHVKVREKYARMHARAEYRGFDWEKDGHLQIKDHPAMFMDPLRMRRKNPARTEPLQQNTTEADRSIVCVDRFGRPKRLGAPDT